ncbi:MAG: hypothetical protein RLZZ230_23 [Candidatus Parcubacteria bacterium]|jgi:hypothetical protein
MNIKNWSIKKRFAVVLFVPVVFFAAWYFLQSPSNNRNWTPDQQLLPYAAMNNGLAEVFNIRNFSYTAVGEYTPAYYNKTFDLSELETVDYIVEPFNGIGAAHTFLSFGFSTGDYLAVSVEIRKEVGESFSPLKGILRNYEIMYVVADERDVIKLRTNFRKDDVYLYPVKTTKENMQKVFVDIMNRINTLKDKPEFYNTLTNTCTTNIVSHVNTIVPGRIPHDLRLLLPKNSDELAYELGLIDTSLPLEELRRKHRINELAEQYADSLDFSQKIRGQ